MKKLNRILIQNKGKGNTDKIKTIIITIPPEPITLQEIHRPPANT